MMVRVKHRRRAQTHTPAQLNIFTQRKVRSARRYWVLCRYPDPEARPAFFTGHDVRVGALVCARRYKTKPRTQHDFPFPFRITEYGPYDRFGHGSRYKYERSV